MLFLVLYCLPEIHFLSYGFTQVLPRLYTNKRLGNSLFWDKVQKAVKSKTPEPRPMLREIFCSPFSFKQKLYDYLEVNTHSLVALAQKTSLRYAAEDKINTYDTSAPVEAHHARCLDELICRLDSLRAALNKVRVEIKELGAESDQGSAEIKELGANLGAGPLHSRPQGSSHTVAEANMSNDSMSIRRR